MRRLLRELQENLEEFVAQEGYALLVLGCEDVALPYVLKTLEGMEAQDPTGAFLNFAGRFRNASSYALESMAMLHAHREAAEGRRPPERPATPPLPAACLAAATAPRDRFVEAARYLRGLLASPTEQRVVLGLLPTEIEDPKGYAELVAQFVPAGAVEPWHDAVRFVVRDDLHGRPLRAALERRGVRDVLTYELDLGNDAMQSALARDAADAAVPEAERMAAMLQLAMLDYSYRRHPQALEKFGVLFSYYGAQGQTGMQAVSQLGAADTLRALGKREAALVRYRSGGACVTRCSTSCASGCTGARTERPTVRR